MPTAMPPKQERMSGYGQGYDSRPLSNDSLQSQEHLQFAPIGYNQRNTGVYSQNYPQYAAENTASYESSHQHTSYDSQPDLHTQYGGSGGYRNPNY